MASLLGNFRYSAYYQRAAAVYQKPEIKISLEIILSVFVVIILIIMAIRPTLSNIASLQKKITDLTVVIKKADNKILELTTVQSRLTENADLLPYLDLSVSPNLGYFNPMKRMEIIAFEKKVRIDSIKAPGKTILGDLTKISAIKRDKMKDSIKEVTGTLIKIPYEVSFYGSQMAVFSMIKDLENMDLVATVDEVIIRKNVDKDQKTNLLANMKITFYSVIGNKP